MSAHALLARGINGRAMARIGDLTILDAEAELSAAIERRGQLYRQDLAAPEGCLLSLDSDIRAGLVLVHLVHADERGVILKTIDTARIAGIDAVLAAAERVAAVRADAEGHVWATDLFAASRGDV